MNNLLPPPFKDRVNACRISSHLLSIHGILHEYCFLDFSFERVFGTFKTCCNNVTYLYKLFPPVPTRCNVIRVKEHCSLVVSFYLWSDPRSLEVIFDTLLLYYARNWESCYQYMIQCHIFECQAEQCQGSEI